MKNLVCIIILISIITLSWADQLTQTVTFHYGDLQFEKVADYDLVLYKGYTSLLEIGNPKLPVRSVCVAIPSGAKVTDIEVIAVHQERLPGSYLIFPSQEPKPINQTNVTDLQIEMNTLIYGSDQPYPRKIVEFVAQADLAGQALAQLHIHPLQYIPAEKVLMLNTQIKFSIQYTMDGKQPEKMERMSEKTKNLYENMIKSMTINPEAVIIASETNGNFSGLPDTLIPVILYLPDHVIITSSALAPCFADLVHWHKKKGIPDTVITTEYIYDNYAGADEQEKIRNFIQYAHTHWGAIWFLLGGDVSVVPTKSKYFYITMEYVPGDMYYGDYDDDWICEVFVGRASVENSYEVSIFSDKVLIYETDPPVTGCPLTTGYPTNALLMGFDADPRTHCGLMKRSIDWNYIPYYFNVSKVYDCQLGNHKTKCLNYLNAGKHLVNHADHGDYNFMGTGYFWHGWGLYNSDMDDLTNGDKQSILYSLACITNGFDYSDCIAEHFVQNPNGGGVAFTGNTRYGWYSSGDPYSLSGFYDMEWWRSLFDYNIYHLGQTLADSKNRNLPGSDAYLQYIVWELSLLGEPELPIWTDTPTSINVSYPTSIPTGTQGFTVTVSDNGNPISGALICVWKGSEVYSIGLTNANGQKNFTIYPRTTGTMYVTVTAHNRLPHEGDCIVY